jgi:cytochrome oxidase assembly protein ShyY1
VLRLLRTPRWIFLLVLAVGLGSLFVKLGFWQWHKHVARDAQNAQIWAGERAAPVPLEQLLPAVGGADVASLAFRRVTATGTFDTAHEVVLYGRTRNQNPGNEVLTPLILADGRTVIVNRGWVPFADNRAPVVDAAPPAGTVTVTGVLEPTETTGTPVPAEGLARSQVTYVDLGQFSSWTGAHVVPLWIHAQAQNPTQPGPLPAVVALPPTDGGPYYGYALQWWFFASLAFLGYPFLLWRSAREERAELETGAPDEDPDPGARNASSL